MARRAGVRYFVLIRHCWRDELEGVGADEGARYTLRLDLRHVARNALAAWSAILVVCVLLKARGVRSVGRVRAVTVEAEFLRRFAELSVVVGAVGIVASCAGHAVAIHHTLHEVITLHTILVARSVRVVEKVSLS